MIIQRLLNRNLHLLALKIAKYLSIDFHGILIHWACYKIKNSTEDEQTLSRVIIERFHEHGQDFFSFTDVAKAAHETGRTQLAIKVRSLYFSDRIASRPRAAGSKSSPIALEHARR